ncbi:efflux RND transporter periplasmic adaptor subunit [Pseudomonas paraeruginosa]|uniref:efflux RND transporter periplasmic adaptor subunit n=1 Tax=Pseudomonas aeruginosa group TaxID=136841 RepID=UPI00053E799D|nr:MULTISPECIES: efflux RND transporter periplasmic adaptor subunit [Pseudomonas aeruginosa group]KAB0743697.1 efflux RND transporter periplasmic adaptor subunit [Pseudomonas aeruginosa]MBG4069592.1 efflux RND transporter periplasmic adaptor subunit [Pseudomonas aeruginosa]MBG5602323.1 efflux RND transporter periplasmic adaptor subunit [Pseudomonas aeruginosa]MBH3670400.1 efflux RND transporter periplasmic adaptor subunit [Pseudomonas aeruginosa]MBH9432977.1 efflux RND transporter periplasmic 
MQALRSGGGRILVAVLAAGLVGVGDWALLRGDGAPNAAPAPAKVPVSVAAVERRDVEQRVSGIGTVTSLHNVVIRTQIDGQLTRLLVSEGQMVEAGELLATIDDRAIVAALEQAQAAKASNQAQLKSAEQDLRRYRSLYAERAVSRQLFEQQQATVAQLRATLKANDATINAERVRLSYTRITSPVGGKVGIRNVDVGNLVRVGDSVGLFSVTQIAPISVVFSLQQEQLPQLQALLGSEAAVRAFSRDGGSTLGEGRLQTIDNQIDSSTGTIRVRATFDNRQARLWPGQFVAVSLHTGVQRDQLVLSSKAVRRGLEGNFVYRVAADRVEAVPVRVLRDVDGISVVEGLAAGDQVVVDGHSRLMPGALVDVQAPRPSVAQATGARP